MKLKEFLEIHGLTKAKFAQMVGVSRPMITYLVHQTQNPSIGLIIKIEEVTNGAVKAKDLFSPEAPSRLKKNMKDPIENP